MENNRFIQIMHMDLTAEILKLEESLEKVFNNSSLPINEKISLSKKLLNKLKLAELTHEKFTNLLVNNENNENNKK